jgi:hypothetical protein
MAIPQIDYSIFQSRLEDGLRKAWQEVRASRPDEHFYLYGIETDSDAVVLTPFCNTIEQVARECEDDDLDAESEFDKWIVDQESVLYGAGAEHTNELQDEVNQFVFLEEPEPEGAADERRDQLMLVFERALIALDREGFFGSGEDRDNVVLKLEIVDADEDEWDFMVASMKRMNPPKSLERFLALLEELDD